MAVDEAGDLCKSLAPFFVRPDVKQKTRTIPPRQVPIRAMAIPAIAPAPRLEFGAALDPCPPAVPADAIDATVGTLVLPIESSDAFTPAAAATEPRKDPKVPLAADVELSGSSGESAASTALTAGIDAMLLPAAATSDGGTATTTTTCTTT